ncbi:MAG: CPBP family intramembrane metalloprotease [Sphingomonas sp.]|nr:CPBP family intramembrane metalloprotease [Sphingomonas sp.]
MMDAAKGNDAQESYFPLAGRLGAIRRMPGWKLMLIAIAFPLVLLAVSSLQPHEFYEAGSAARFWSLNIWTLHLPMFALLVGALAMKWGGLKAADLGFSPRGLPALLAAPLLAWVGTQLTLSLVSGSAFSMPGAAQYPAFAANLFATGFNEEGFFRGVLFVQLGLLLRHRFKLRDHKALVVSGLMSAIWFALSHFQFTLSDFAVIALGGVIGCLLYARTANLYFVIGLHGLFNAPLALFSVSDELAKLVVIGWMLALAATYPLLRGVMETGDGRSR